MEDFGLQRLHFCHRERGCFGQHALRSSVAIEAISVLKIYAMRTLKALHFDAFLTHTGHLIKRFRSRFCDQLERNVMWQVVDTIGHIEGSSACHVNGFTRSHDLIAGDMPHTAYIFHSQFH